LLSKIRFENLSDALFAIVMTLLVIELKIPEHLHSAHTKSNILWEEMLKSSNLLISFFISFLVIYMFWLSHNFLYNSFAKNINRTLLLLNMIYLSLIALIPYSSHLLGTFFDNSSAVIFYGGNILAVSLVDFVISQYILRSKTIENHQISSRAIKQGLIRRSITISFTLIGILLANFSTLLAIIFYLFPIGFNIIPGLLNKAEKILGIKL
jgi:uncharacterized membrane protein